MANKLVIEIETKNADAAAASINKVGNSIDTLNQKVGKTGQSLDSFIAQFPEKYRKQVAAGFGLGGGGGGGGGGGVPPIIPPPIMPSGPGGGGGGGGGNSGWGRALLGIVAGIFSPFAGARILNGLGGSAGGTLGAIFGSGGTGGFGAIFVGLQAATRLLRFEFEALAKAVREGSKLFTNAGVAGRSPSQLFSLQAAGASIGIGPETINRLAYQQNLLRPGGRTFDASGQMLKAAGSFGDSESGTRIAQARQQFDSVFKNFQMLDDTLDDSSKSLFYFESNVSQLVYVFKAGLIIAAGDLARVFNLLGQSVQNFTLILPILVHGMEGLLSKLLNLPFGDLLPRLIKLLPNGPDLAKDILLTGNSSRPESSWEKMGLIIGGGLNATDYAKQTADNTKKIADAMTGKASSENIFDKIMNAYNSP